MQYKVATAVTTARPTAVVKAVTTWPEFSRAWKNMLDKVWACLNSNGITGGCPNIMLYLDDRPSVEIGVELVRQCALSSPVVASQLPAGQVASTIHRGPYSELSQAHKAVVNWCEGQNLELAGPRWEIYGPNAPSPEVTIFYLLKDL